MEAVLTSCCNVAGLDEEERREEQERLKREEKAVDVGVSGDAGCAHPLLRTENSMLDIYLDQKKKRKKKGYQ